MMTTQQMDGVADKTSMKPNSGQMELSLCIPRGSNRVPRAASRRVRARWWFDRMREAVSAAPEWPALPNPEDHPRHGTLTVAGCKS